MSASFGRRWRLPVLATVALLLTAGLLSAHDFWIVPDAFQIATGGTLEVRGQTSTRFPTSQSAVGPDRVAEARLVGASTDERITDLTISGKSLLLRHRPTTPGQRIVAVTLTPRTTRTTPATLRHYIALEGAPALAERYEREGVFPKTDSVTQVSGKFAKTLVEVGQAGPRAFTRAVGHALELIPRNDPAALHAGDTLVVRLLYHGQPVSGAVLRAGAVPAGITAVSDSSQLAGAAASPGVQVETGPEGIARVVVGAAGLWNVRTLYASKSPSTGDTWEVFFATLVFLVGETGAAPSSSPDSSDVAAVVRRFDELMAAGDSTGILGLLADDLTVLESGGMETRSEFRAHHLPADIEFARAVTSEQGPIVVRILGDVAWASSTSTVTGELRGRTISSVSAELMVLSRTPGGWKIRAIHWSSRSRRTPG